jgi:hypothetical protein
VVSNGCSAPNSPPRPIGYGAKYPDVREKVPFIRPGERR